MVVRELITALGFKFDPTGADKADQAVDKLRSGLKGLAAAFAGSQAIKFLNGMIQQTAAVGDGLDKAQARVGMTARALQELRYAGEQSGVATRNLDISLQRFNRRTAEAVQGTGVAKAAFEQMGVRLRDISTGAVRPMEEILGDVADRMAAIDDEGERVRLAFQFFDTDGAPMVNMLKGGSAALEQMRAEARELGVVMSDELIAASVQLTSQKQRLRDTLIGLRNVYATQMIPWMDRGIQRFVEWVRVNRELLQQRIEQFARGVAAAFDVVWGAARGVVQAIDSLGKSFGETGRVGVWLMTVFGALALIMGLNRMLTVGTIAAIILLLEDFFGMIVGKDSLILHTLNAWGGAWRSLWRDFMAEEFDFSEHPFLKFVQSLGMYVAEAVRRIGFLADLIAGKDFKAALDRMERADPFLVRDQVRARAQGVDPATVMSVAPIMSMAPGQITPRPGAVAGGGAPNVNMSVELHYTAADGGMSSEEFEERARRAIADGTREALRGLPLSPGVP